MSDVELLLRSQKKSIFRAIHNAGLEPSDFNLAKSSDTNKFSANAPNALKVTHVPTGYYFIFDWHGNNWATKYFPAPSQGQEVSEYWITNWEKLLNYFYEWLAIVYREHSEPDLWSASEQEKRLIAEQIDDLENSPFSDGERLRISSAIHEIREFLIASDTRTESQIQFITSRLNHLEEASHRLGRKDWVTLAMGTLTNIIVGIALAPEAARELVRTAGALLGWVVGGIHLLP